MSLSRRAENRLFPKNVNLASAAAHTALAGATKLDEASGQSDLLALCFHLGPVGSGLHSWPTEGGYGVIHVQA